MIMIANKWYYHRYDKTKEQILLKVEKKVTCWDFGFYKRLLCLI